MDWRDVGGAPGVLPRIFARYLRADSRAKQAAGIYTVQRNSEEDGMANIIWTIVVVLLILWALGFFFAGSLGPIIHLLLVLALIAIVYNLITGRRAV